MPKKIYPNESRDWLKLYESGKSEADIARKVKRDVRTVKKRVNQARQEREMHGAKIELLKSALQRHQDKLINSVKGVESAVAMPPEDIWKAYAIKEFSSPVGFIGFIATYETGIGWVVSLAAENKLEWELLKEHLKGDSLWINLSAWKKALAVHIKAEASLDAKCLDLLKESGYKIVKRFESVEPPYIYLDTSLGEIYSAVRCKALGLEIKMEFADMIVGEKDTGYVKYNKGIILGEVLGEAESCKKKMIAIYKELVESSEAKRLEQTYRELEEAVKKARRIIEEILLLEMIPGDCRVCRRLGA